MARTAIALVSLLFVLTGAAIAQEGGPPAPAEPPAPPEAAVEPAAPPPAEIVYTQIYRDWAHRCGITGDPPALSCVIYTQNGGETTAGPAFARISLAVAAATGETVIALDYTRPPVDDHGVALQIDGGPAFLTATPICGELSCQMVVRGEDAEQLAAFLRQGSVAVATFLGTNSVPIRVQLSLMGFTAASNALAAGPPAAAVGAAN
jgi:invasion protein IalB